MTSLPPHESGPEEQRPHPNHDRGLEFDLSTMLSRRSLGMFFGAGGAAAALAACTPGGSSPASQPASAAADGLTPPASASPSAATRASATPLPHADPRDRRMRRGDPAGNRGPVPRRRFQRTQRPDASGVVRQDITSSFGTATATAEGVPLTFTLTLLDNANGCVPLAGAAVYAWHCDRDGQYSLYDSSLTNENYLRGVQEADANGQVTFTSIFPGAYSGRWPHIHFEVFESMNNATAAGRCWRFRRSR